MNKWDAVDIAQEVFKGYEREAREYILDRDFWYSMTPQELKKDLLKDKDYTIKHQLSEYQTGLREENKNLIAYLENVGYSREEITNIRDGSPLTYPSPKITNAKQAFKLLHEYTHKTKEHFICLTLDGSSNVINKHLIHIGTINQSLVHPREVFYPAINDLATGIIIAHNHPSNTLEPSRADIQITQRLKEVAKLVGIELLDHIILTRDGYYSFSDEAML